MRDRLPTKPHRNESGIVNLDNSENADTHWIAYAKKGNNAIYFDGFGNLRPPREFERYLGGNVTYNHRSYQTFNHQNNCVYDFFERLDLIIYRVSHLS